MTALQRIQITLTEAESLILGLAKERELELLARAQELASKALSQAVESMIARGALPAHSHAEVSLASLDRLPYPTRALIQVRATEECRPEGPATDLAESEPPSDEATRAYQLASALPPPPPAGSLGSS